ncbi:hypothetical protein ACM41_23260 [Bradyrhizobium sp. CCBAU 21362]|nr:hypothetical protein [Bradyrhizobium sp. CCBAU 21362]
MRADRVEPLRRAAVVVLKLGTRPRSCDLCLNSSLLAVLSSAAQAFCELDRIIFAQKCRKKSRGCLSSMRL